MRRAIIFAALLIAWPAVAQSPPPMFPERARAPQTINDRIAAQLGALMIENAGLAARNEELQAQISALRQRVQEMEKSKPADPH